jgi:hypothetical protein
MTEPDKIFSGIKLCQLWTEAHSFCPQLTQLVAQEDFINIILVSSIYNVHDINFLFYLFVCFVAVVMNCFSETGLKWRKRRK